MRSVHQQRVDEFMRLAQQELPEKPLMNPSFEIRRLRAKLILEEALETIYNGLGIIVTVRSPKVPGHWLLELDNQFQFQDNDSFDMIETIDGCCDIKVVTTGTLSALGIPDEPFQDEVDKNNLAKFGPGGWRRDDGKWMKPPDHKAPDIAGILKELETPPDDEGGMYPDITDDDGSWEQHEIKAGRNPSKSKEHVRGFGGEKRM